MRTGWLMGFEVEQTYKELRVMGYYRDSIAILMQWGKWEKEMQERFNNGN